MKERSENMSQHSDRAVVAVPLAADQGSVPASFAVSPADENEIGKRMLLIRLSDAAERIRQEGELIRRTGFTDGTSRLVRILAEAVDEQRLALGEKSK